MNPFTEILLIAVLAFACAIHIDFYVLGGHWYNLGIAILTFLAALSVCFSRPR